MQFLATPIFVAVFVVVNSVSEVTNFVSGAVTADYFVSRMVHG